MSCNLFNNLVKKKKRAMKKQVKLYPRAPGSGVAGRTMLANVSQNSFFFTNITSRRFFNYIWGQDM